MKGAGRPPYSPGLVFTDSMVRSCSAFMLAERGPVRPNPSNSSIDTDAGSLHGGGDASGPELLQQPTPSQLCVHSHTHTHPRTTDIRMKQHANLFSRLNMSSVHP